MKKLPRILRELEPATHSDRRSLEKALRDADYGPHTFASTIAMTAAPLVVITYQPDEDGVLTFAAAHAFATNKEAAYVDVSDHVLALNVPLRLPSTYSSRALTGALTQRPVYVLGQVNLRKQDLAYVQKHLSKLRTTSMVSRYYLNAEFKKDWKLSKLLRFCALDVMFDLNDRLIRAIPASTMEAHLFTIGFRPYNSHMGFAMQACCARDLCVKESPTIAAHMENHKRRNSEYVITKLAVVPSIPTQAIANVIMFQPTKE